MKTSGSQLQLQAMVWPGTIFLLIFCYIPMYGIIIAFKDYSLANSGIGGFFNAPWAGQHGLEHFVEFFGDNSFFNVLKNTVGMNLLGLILGFPAPIIFALLLNEMKDGFFKKIVQTVSYLPHFVSWVIFGGLCISLLNTETGIINVLLKQFGLIKESVPFLADPKYFWWLVVITGIIKGVGFSSILYLAAISGIDQEIYEASVIDGAGRIRKMLHVTLPCISGTIVIMLIFTISGMLSSGFDQIWVLQNNLNLDASETIDTYVYKLGINDIRYSYSTAVNLFRSVIAMGLLLLSNFVAGKISDKGFI